MDFVCICPCLVPVLSALLKEKVGDNHTNIMEGEVVRLGNTLEFFNKGGRTCCAGPQSLFYLRAFP